MHIYRTSLKPIGPIAPNWDLRLRAPVLELSTFGYSSTHNALQVLQITALGPAPDKADP